MISDDPIDFRPVDSEFKVRWLAALRSGRYKQGHQALRIKDDGKVSYCCLGVACNLLDPKWKSSEDNFLFYDWKGDFSYSTEDLPFLEKGAAQVLIAMNDDDKKDFSAIADWIEENL